jgi:predicted AAA+ superfamily ATPase
MLPLENWSLLAQRLRVVGLEARSVDRDNIFSFFCHRSQEKQIPCYYWNSGYKRLQLIQFNFDKPDRTFQLVNSNFIPDSEDILDFLLEKVSLGSPAIYILDDLCNFDEINLQQQRHRQSQIQNILHKFSLAEQSSYLILLGEYIQFSSKLLAEVPVLKYPLPNEFEVKSLVQKFCSDRGLQIKTKSSLQKLVIACGGLPRGEINLTLKTHALLSNDVEELAELVLSHKTKQLRGIGLEFIAEPDIDTAGGLDLLQQFLSETVVKLNEPSAKKYNLRPPRGMLLMGPPGTGKSLCAKLTAKALGYSLLALSWGNVLGSDNPDRTLASILEIADCLDKCILLADDFDKGFTGWEEGGVSRRLSQRLLTWMQEHTSNVMMVATVNRIQLLPSEIKRRFDDGGIWFVDLPDMGAMYEIFCIHLAKYFPAQFGDGKEPWSDRDWYRLLKSYRGATAVEIALSVARSAQDFYCSLTPEQRDEAEIEAQVTIDALLAQLAKFEMASVRDAEDLQAIRNTAYYARPASSSDTSRFAIKKQQLFDYQAHELETAI